MTSAGEYSPSSDTDDGDVVIGSEMSWSVPDTVFVVMSAGLDVVVVVLVLELMPSSPLPSLLLLFLLLLLLLSSPPSSLPPEVVVVENQQCLDVVNLLQYIHDDDDVNDELRVEDEKYC